MPAWNAFSYMFGPLVGFFAIGAMVLVLRWGFRRGQSVVERPSKSGSEQDYGLLVPVASPSNHIQGELLRQQLVDAGVRASLATTTDGPRVLVWPRDAQTAQKILSQSPQ